MNFNVTKVLLGTLIGIFYTFVTYLLFFCELSGKGLIVNCHYLKTESYGSTCEITEQLKYYMKDYDVQVIGTENFRSKVNYIQIHDTEVEFLPQKLFEALENAKVFEISNSNLKVIDQHTLSGANSVEKLILKNNKIKFMSSNAFENLTNLKYLNLEGNQLESLDENLFSTNVHLETIILKNNKINFVGKKTLSKLNKLKTLDLSDNKCTSRVFVGADMPSLSEKLNTCIGNMKNTQLVTKFQKRQEKDYRELQKLYDSQTDPNISKDSPMIYWKCLYTAVLVTYIIKMLWNKLLLVQKKEN